MSNVNALLMVHELYKSYLVEVNGKKYRVGFSNKRSGNQVQCGVYHFSNGSKVKDVPTALLKWCRTTLDEISEQVEV